MENLILFWLQCETKKMSSIEDPKNNKCGCSHDGACSHKAYCELNVERTCGFKTCGKIYHSTKDEFETDLYTGSSYKCEDCGQYGCKKCLWRDCWNERLEDGVFMCYPCYRRNQIFMDMM